MADNELSNLSLTQLPDDLFLPILNHLGIKDLVLTVRLVSKDWKVFADQLINEKIEVKRAELARRFIVAKKNAIEDEYLDSYNMDKGIKTLIVDAAQHQYLPLIWQKTSPNDNKETLEQKKHFNKTLQEFVSAIAKVDYYSSGLSEREKQFQNEAILVRKNLQNAELTNSDDYSFRWLPMANITGANFTDSSLGHANLDKMDLSHTNFTNARLDWASFRGTNFSRANFTNVQFGNGWNDLTGAILTGANFTKAQFSRTDLAKINLKDVNLTEANLSYVENLDPVSLLYASSLKGVKLPTNFDFHRMNLSDLDLSHASIESAQLYKANLLNTNLSNAELTKIKASYANFDGANLSGANLKQAHLYGTNFSDCDLSNANLSHATDVDKANFAGANLTQANLSYIDFTDAKNLTAKQLLSADSLIEITLSKSQFNKEELDKIKIKMISDYRKFFNENNFDQILELLLKIESNETHTLKIQRDLSLNDYGRTSSYADVINYGRKKLVELAKTDGFLPPNPHTKKYADLQKIFNASVYNWHSGFWGDNAKEALQSILNPLAKDVDYQFSPKK